MKNDSCAILSDPPELFPWGLDEEDECCVALKLLLLNRISWLRTQGVHRFAVGMNAGAGLCAAEIVCGLRGEGEDVWVDAYVPYEGLATKWTPGLRERYFDVLADCLDTYTASPENTPTCEIEGFMDAIETTDMLLAVCGGERPKSRELSMALQYALRRGKEIAIVRPPHTAAFREERE